LFLIFAENLIKLLSASNVFVSLVVCLEELRVQEENFETTTRLELIGNCYRSFANCSPSSFKTLNEGFYYGIARWEGLATSFRDQLFVGF
jgi:hypothetical protein